MSQSYRSQPLTSSGRIVAWVNVCRGCGTVTADRDTHDHWHGLTPGANDGATPISLTPRQLDVVRELRRDAATYKQIARRLSISEETVRSHLKKVYAATGCHDRTALVLAITTGRIVLDPDITQEEK